ncbi:MAG: ABC transporter permease [Metamycoplasmataceae bacterium]
MFKYIFKRTIINLVTLLVLVVFAYLLIASFSKNPFAGEDPDKALELFKANGLDRPILIRLWEYLGGMFTDGFGKIYVPQGGEVNNIPQFFFSSLKWSILITLPALIISAILGFVLGTIAGYKRGTWVDGLINVFVLLFTGLPSFVLAPIMILLAGKIPGFLVEFRLPQDGNWWITLKSLFLPTLTVTLASLTVFTILCRNQIVTILSSNHILIARSKGLSNWEIFTKYIIRNISIPIISVVLPSFVYLLAGNFIIEQFFGVPGVSSIIIQSFPKGEVNITMFSIFIFSTISLFIQLILDMAYVFIDPRIKYVSSEKNDIFVKIKYMIIRFKNSKKAKINKSQNNDNTDETNAEDKIKKIQEDFYDEDNRLAVEVEI